MQLLRAYPWPGNVRELENLLERAYAFGVKDEIRDNADVCQPNPPVVACSPAGITSIFLKLDDGNDFVSVLDSVPPTTMDGSFDNDNLSSSNGADLLLGGPGKLGLGTAYVEGLQAEVTDHLWSIARRAAQDAGRDPDARKTAMRINLEPGTSVDSVVGKLERLAGSGADEAIVDAFAMFSSLDQMLEFAGQVIAEWSDRGKA